MAPQYAIRALAILGIERDMDKIVIERRLRMHILNLCLAVAGKREGDISICKEKLIHEVQKIANDAAPSSTTRE